MVLIFDGPQTWRRDYFPNYKASRRKSRKDDGRDWKSIFESFNTVRNEINDNMPYLSLYHNKAEGDDIIGILVKHLSMTDPMEKVMIVSSDHDFIQLHQYPMVEQYSPLKQQKVHGDAEDSLHEKIYKGDAGDGVPNVFSPDDQFVKEDAGRQKSITKKLLEEWKSNPPTDINILRNIERNKTLVDLSMIPSRLTDDIIKLYEDGPQAKPGKMMNYFITNRLSELTKCLNDFI